MRGRSITITQDEHGLWGSSGDEERFPVGVLVDAKPVLLVKYWEDDEEHCAHCDGVYCLNNEDGTDDQRCGRCHKSHRDCEKCDRFDAEVCIECDAILCSACWTDHLNDDDKPCVSGVTPTPVPEEPTP